MRKNLDEKAFIGIAKDLYRSVVTLKLRSGKIIHIFSSIKKDMEKKVSQEGIETPEWERFILNLIQIYEERKGGKDGQKEY